MFNYLTSSTSLMRLNKFHDIEIKLYCCGACSIISPTCGADRLFCNVLNSMFKQRFGLTDESSLSQNGFYFNVDQLYAL